MEVATSGLDKVFDGVIRALPLPSIAEEGIIAVKNIIKDEDSRNKIIGVFNNLFNGKGNIIKNIWDVKETIKEDGLKEGISKAVDVIISNAKSSKLITANTASNLKGGKEIIVNEILKDKNTLLDNQEKILKNIDKKYLQWEKYMEEKNIEKTKEIGNEIKKEYMKLLPTIELIEKVNNIDNVTNLITNKNSSITSLEKEILQKTA